MRFLAFLLLFAALLCAFSLWAKNSKDTASTLLPSSPERITAVVLDAGHGGEDGGASSVDGIIEKHINLEIAFLLRDLLEANGIRVIMTRTADTLLYDKNSDYHGRKKVLDLTERKRIAEEHPNAVFVSIHMNTYPLQSCQGLQVWYSKNDPRSLPLAENIQAIARQRLDPQNDRTVKEANRGIYLLQHIQTPAVLVECGFLSNPQEAERLASKDYQKEVALAIFLAIVQTEFQSKEA
jgi:N-acetylmuramoyl-L-alanine amidase